MFPAEFLQLFSSGLVLFCDLLAEIAKGGVDPECLPRFFVKNRYYAQRRKPGFPFVGHLDHNQIVTFCQRFKVIEVTFVNKIGYQDDDASPLNDIHRE